jgi:organic radical activating enzyme
MSANELSQGVHNGPKTLSVMPTFTCPAECADCGTVSSPRDRTNLPLDTILAGITQATRAGFANVVFTGGEPTLRWKDLLAAIAHARGLGFPTRLVTNAHWAVSLERAGERLDELLAAGLDEINYSTGDEHARFVPMERVVHATIAALERGLRPHVMVELREQRRVSKQDVLEHPLIAALPAEERDRIHINESPWMPLDPSRVERYPDGLVTNRANVGVRTGCDSILQTYVLQADGRIGSCCGLGMRIIPELNVALAQGEDFLLRAIEEAENDFLKVWIHYKGPEKILAWAAEKDPSIDWEDRYAHRCQACLRLYQDPVIARVVREHYMEMVGEVLQCAWLDDVHIPEQLGETVKVNPRCASLPKVAPATSAEMQQ